MIIVLDSNVLLAGFAVGGVCRAVVGHCLRFRDVRLSEYIFQEFSRNLARKFRMPPEEIDANTRFLRERCALVTPAVVPAEACVDPGDLPVLGTLAAAGAECLITGDSHLLKVGAFGGGRILSPRQFASEHRASQSDAR